MPPPPWFKYKLYIIWFIKLKNYKKNYGKKIHKINTKYISIN